MPVLNRVAGAVTRRMPKAISPTGHAVADYLMAGTFFLWGALAWPRHKRAALGAFLCGAAEVAVSLLTDYPGGAKELITFPLHGKIDLGLAAMTAAMPGWLDFKDDRENQFFLLQGGAITVLTNLTDFSPRARRREQTLHRRPIG